MMYLAKFLGLDDAYFTLVLREHVAVLAVDSYRIDLQNEYHVSPSDKLQIAPKAMGE